MMVALTAETRVELVELMDHWKDLMRVDMRGRWWVDVKVDSWEMKMAAKSAD